ncbi:MAG: rhodanese-like protein [Rhodospirillaceae bacterium]|nr:MAG: rhodanese-like protein [Rhodospirillaceae bacterium]
MTLPTIDVSHARRLIDEGAVLVDIRESDEHARERVPSARHHALSRLSSIDTQGATAVIFHCRSGARTAGNAQRLAASVECDAYILEGGIDAWRKAGLAIAVDRRQPIEIMRQVQITAGSLVVLGVMLGVWVAPAYFALSAFVGAGLAFAGITGWCGMAKLLALMPWNRRTTAATV